MDGIAIAQLGQVNYSENSINVAGYTALASPHLVNASTTIGDTPLDETDPTSLEKARHTGFNVPSLDYLFESFKIAPIRDPNDLWKIIGYGANPTAKSSGKIQFDSKHVTALVFLFPVPHEPGHVYPYTDYIRIRPASPVKSWHDSSGEWKYLQPTRKNTSTHSEPYFLVTPDSWTRVMNSEFPLFITEGELKAAALGLAGYAAISFPGAQMMFADRKQGKNKLHPSLDPNGPRKGKTIPITDREIYVTPDSDFIENKDVRSGFKSLIRNLVAAGADAQKIKLVIVPPPVEAFGKNGIDDYITKRLGPSWGFDEPKIAAARELVDALVEQAKTVSVSEFLYPATSHVRGAERFLEQFNQPEKHLGLIRANDKVGHTVWAMYNCDHYILYPMHVPLNGTSTKLAFKDDALTRMAMDTWDEGVQLASVEEDQDGKREAEMNADYPNRMFGLVQPQLNARYNETLIEPFPGVDMNDHCLRIRGGLINVTKFFQTGVAWKNRGEWLLPPNHRWFGTGQVGVSFTNLDEEPTCPTFNQTIQNMFDGDAECIECLQMTFGKIILCPMFLERNNFVALYGTAGSGKSTLTNLLVTLIGMHDIAVLRGNFGGRFDTSELPGKRLILFPENEDGTDHFFTTEMTATIKKITGRDMLTIEKKGMQPISSRVDAEIMIVGNAPPSMQMDEEAFLRRAVFLKATNKIRNPDHGISKAKMETVELPGILLWALQGAYKLWQGNRYRTPACCMEDLESATLTQSPEKRFIQTMVVEKEGKKLYMSELEDMYRMWLRHQRLPVKEPGWGKFTGAIREKYADKYKSEPTKDKSRRSTRMYRGLDLGEMLF